MDRIDWAVFFVALLAIPISAWANIRYWRKLRASELPRDRQSLWMIFIGLVCMVAIVLYYSAKFSPWADIANTVRGSTRQHPGDQNATPRGPQTQPTSVPDKEQ